MKLFEKLYLGIVVFCLTMFCTLAFADVAAIPESDTVALISQLVSNYKVLGPLTLGILVVTLLSQGAKALLGESFKYKRLLVLSLSIIYSVLLAVSTGAGLVPAVASVLLTSGGAMSFYEALKGAGIIQKPSA